MSSKLVLGAAAAFVAAGGGFVLAVLIAETRRKAKEVISNNVGGEGQVAPDPDVQYDVIICGAGPAGATAAFFLGQAGKRVLLIDKKAFPRAKPCGDAWCKPALDLLDEMGILPQMEKDGVAYPVKRGGLISPFGYECINTDGGLYGAVTGCKTYAIKRYLADNYLVKAAQALSSVTMLENTEVTDAVFTPGSTPSSTDPPTAGFYTCSMKKDATTPEGATAATASFVLVCDGSTSYLGQKLGLVPKGLQAEATCSHQYIKASSHTWSGPGSADGVMIFSQSVLPGYSALFRHADGDVYLGTYVLPGGRATSRAIDAFEGELVKEHPYCRAALGDKFALQAKRVVAPIRCGGVAPGKVFQQQLFLVGDAAGHVDPLTGEGIHTAMVAGKIAASVIVEMEAKGNYSLRASEAYAERCYSAFGYEFVSSALAAKIIFAFPISIDAVTVVGARRGQSFLDFFGECMTGVRPKSDFLRDPLLLLELALECGRQVVLQHLLRRSPLVPKSIGREVVDKHWQQQQQQQQQQQKR